MEAVGADDELFVVIVENDDEEKTDRSDLGSKDRRKQVFDIKQEPTGDEIAVEELIETAEKYGQLFDVNIKQEACDEDYGEDEYDENTLEYVQESSEEYAEEEYLNEYPKRKRQVKEKHRYTMLKASEQRSFVKELQKEHPELKEDQELLIDTLSRIMLDIKRPKLPKDYFIMDGIMFECVQCGSKSDSVPAAGRHWQERHGPRYLICFACGVDFRSTTNLYKHEKRCSAPDATIVLKARARTLGCKGRGRPFLVKSMSFRKMKVKSEKVEYPCSQCAARFKSKQTWRAHELAHIGARPYRCHLCPAAYTSSCGLSKHHRAKHTDIQFICDDCSKSFKTKSSLIVHLDTHRPLRKFECGECGRRYAQKMALQLHVDRDHRRLPPPCACQLCPRRYPRMSLLKSHMLKEHGMTLITRKMFHKALPTLTDTQIKQAKVVLKSDVAKIRETDYILRDEMEASERDQSLSEELMEYIHKVNQGEPDDSSTRYIVIHNGEAVYVDKTGFHKNYHIEAVEHELENNLQVQYEIVDDEDNKADVLRQIQLLQQQNEMLESRIENETTDRKDNNVLSETSGLLVTEGTEKLKK